MTSASFRPRLLILTALPLVLTWSAVMPASASRSRFFADDPLAREPESQDASRARPSDVGLLYDLSYGLFVTARNEPSNIHALNVNTIDELPDSGWFTNRILPRQLTLDDLVRGPNAGPPPNPARWVVVREKSAGFSPGFTAMDGDGETWFISFDTPGNAEGATAAMAIASRIFWALGYNQVETFITKIDPTRLTIDPTATMRRPNGKRTRIRRADLNAILERAAQSADGTYRAAAGRLLPGTVLGPFRYKGTRPDDPNDVVPHEHRRELRALRVFGAWTNLTDLKAGNTLDTLVAIDGRSVVRHYLQDVGSTFGIGANGPHDRDEGFEYFYEGSSSRRRLMTLGLARSPWQRVDYAPYPSIGRFESDYFDPLTWKPHAPTAGFIEMLADDAFWAARRVAAFDDEAIRAIVRTGQFSDPAAEQHFVSILRQRRDKVARAYLPAVNPIVDACLSAAGDLTFENAATEAGVAGPPPGYRAVWGLLDDATGQTRPLGTTDAVGPALKAPGDLPSAAGTIVEADVSATGSSVAAWQQPVRLYFRRGVNGFTLVGLDRGIGGAAPGQLTERREP
jgi:hypothetical protein